MNEGLARSREFSAMDCFGFSASEVELDLQIQQLTQAYQNIFSQVSLPVKIIEAATGRVGAKKALEFFYPMAGGIDACLFCEACGYAANLEVAASFKEIPPQEDLLPVSEVATPDTTTIKSLAEFLHIPVEKTAKAVFLMASMPAANHKSVEKFIFAVVRGDTEVNETLLASQIGAVSLRPATQEEIRATGAVPGYASPIGLKDVFVVVDDLIPSSPNLVAGANKEGFHLRHVNFGRDYQAQQIANIVLAHEGQACPKCKSGLQLATGTVVGKLTQVGEQPELSFLSSSGQTQALQMLSGSIGIGKLLSCIVEQHHDQWGILFSVNVAPYPIHMVILKDKTGQVETLAANLEEQLALAGWEALIDDRSESAGVKFMDADLIGMPIRITISERAIQQGGVELKSRSHSERRIVPLDKVVSEIQVELFSLLHP
jgi:prolyl-tRNA synthetase